MDPNTGIAAMQGADATFAAVAASLDELVAKMEAASSQAMDASAARTAQRSLLLGLLGLAACGAAVGAAWWMQRKVVQDQRRAVGVATDVAAGNLSADAQTTRDDEVGDLMRSLGAMTRQLRSSLQTVMQSSSSIESASTEIATGSLDLSTRTEQTASNLQQAASSIGWPRWFQSSGWTFPENKATKMKPRTGPPFIHTFTLQFAAETPIVC